MKKTVYSGLTLILVLMTNGIMAQAVSLLAGGTGTGTTNGITIAAKFNAPSDLCVNSLGHIFIVDRNNNVIRKIDEYGVSSVFAGSGTPGFANGAGTAASFNFPIGICIDASDNLYVADFGNNRIRQITPSQVVSTWAGTGASGSTNGGAGTATFQGPSGLCFDAGGDMYITEYSGHRVRKLSTFGIVSTFATGITNAWDICVGNSGNLFVTNMGTDQVRMITPAGAVSVFAGSGTAGNIDGLGTSASFNDPAGICYNGTSLFVADASNHLIRQISSTGAVTTFAGNGNAALVNGSALGSSFNSPNSVAFDSFGNLLVADAANHAIRSICSSSIPSFTTNVTNSDICLGSATTFSANGANNWFNFGWTNGITNGASYTPTNTGVFTATVVGLNYSNGCTNQSTVTYTVNPSPTLSVSNGTICSGNSFTINPSGATSYSYSGGNAIVSPTATTIYSVTGANGNCAQTKTLSVTVNTSPVISANSGTICSGSSFNLSPSGTSTYTVSGGSAVVSPTTTTSYTINGTSAQGCVTQSPFVSTIIVNAIPTITAGNGTICAGSSFTLNPSGATSYTYSGGGSAVVSPTTTTVYNITGSDGICSSAKSVTVNVNPLPATHLNSNFSVQNCPGSILEIYAVAGNNSFNSTINGVPTTLNSNANYTVTLPNQPVEYYSIVVTNTNTGCSKTLTTYTANILNGSVQATSSTSLLCTGQTAVLTASILPGSVAMVQGNALWNPGTNWGSYTVSVSPTTNTTYTFSITDAATYNCTYSTTITQSVSTCTGIDEATNSISISIYPNPANEMINVGLENVNDNITIQIVNTLGEVVMAEKMQARQTSLNIHHLVSGVYFVKVESGEGKFIKKFIKH